MMLKVTAANKEDVYRDIVRIREEYRLDKHGKKLDEGSVCKLEASGKTVYALIRGNDDSEQPIIRIDERLRNRLGVKEGDLIDPVLNKAGFTGQFIWAWNSTDPAYRVVARIGAISVILGLLALILGIISLF